MAGLLECAVWSAQAQAAQEQSEHSSSGPVLGSSRRGSLCGSSAKIVYVRLQGDSVTRGLKKVTDDMKAKNRADRTGTVSASTGRAMSLWSMLPRY